MRAEPARRAECEKASPERRRANNKMARCAINKIIRIKNRKKPKKRRNSAVFQSPKRQTDYQGYRLGPPDRTISGSAMPILIGAALIAAAILLSTLITAVGTRFAGLEGSNDENMWLIDRLTGRVYKCQAPERGKASCEAEIATGSIATGERGKH
jgi:hypothetical protein